MIVKSMARKAPSFAQLIEYIARDADQSADTMFSRNLHYQGGRKALIAAEFVENNRYLKKIKDGNALYHEIIALEPMTDASKDEQIEILKQMAEQWCQLRAPENLVWGAAHLDTDYPHIHLMISSNKIADTRRLRLSKKAFLEHQQILEREMMARFPELDLPQLYCRTKDETRVKTKNNEQAMLQRGGQSQKLALRDFCALAIDQARDLKDFESALSDAGLTLYQRGKHYGVTAANGRKFRLKTLGLSLDGLGRTEQLQKKTDSRQQILRKDRADMAHQIMQELERGEE